MKPRLIPWSAVPPLVVTVALAMLLISLPRPGGHLSVIRAAENGKTEQTPEEAQKALMELIQGGKIIRGVTTRGQTVDQAPPFKVVDRESQIDMYPCSDCHADQVPDRRVRKLKEEHTDLVFDHGGGRFWCYDVCHNPPNMDKLITFRGQLVSYNESYKLCGECHFEPQKDWYFGGHGKRAGAWPDLLDIPKDADKLLVTDRKKIGTWRGERVLLPCTSCHNPHSPSIKPFEPSPPPQVRSGLTMKPIPAEKEVTVWNRLASEKGAE